MSAMPNEFAKQYAEMSDAALLATNRADLVPAAQAAYDQEMDERGLTVDDVPGEPEQRRGEDLVNVSEFDSVADAEQAVEHLKKHGIPAYIAVAVPEAFARQAVQLLDPGVPDDELEALAEATPMPEDE